MSPARSDNKSLTTVGFKALRIAGREDQWLRIIGQRTTSYTSRDLYQYTAVDGRNLTRNNNGMR